MGVSTIIGNVVGIYLIAIGLALFIRPFVWSKWINELDEESPFVLTWGVIAILFGAVIVSVHNVWTSDQRVIITLIGWLALLKGFVYLTLPEYIMKFKDSFFTNAITLRILGVFVLGLGYILAFG